MGDTLTLVDPQGRAVDMEADQVPAALRAGYKIERDEEEFSRLGEEVVEERNSGVLNAVGAGVLGVV